MSAAMTIMQTACQMNRLPEILFGSGVCSRVGERVSGYLGRNNALVLCDPAVSQAPEVKALLYSLEAAGVRYLWHDQVVPDPPFDLVDRIGRDASRSDVDVIVGIGGGSAMDAAKGVAVAVGTDSPLRSFAGVDRVPYRKAALILVPTTAGTGSEVTNVAVFSDQEHNKIGIVSPHIIPDVALLDPELTIGVPPQTTAIAGLDAMAHALESFSGVYNSFLTEPYALCALRYVAEYLGRAHRNPRDRVARQYMLRASLLSGVAFTNTQTGGAHACAMPLGTRCRLAHGEAVIQMLPAVMRYNLLSATERYARAAVAFGCATESTDVDVAARESIAFVERFAAELGVKIGLARHGLSPPDLPELAELSLKNQRIWANNPRQPTIDDIVEIYRDAL